MVMNFDITIWGARGSLPIAHPDFQKYGGATPCIEIQIGSHLLIIDAGSGIQQLGRKWSKSKERIEAHLFLSHVHYDHLQGFPFFQTAYVANNEIHIYAERKNDQDAKAQLEGMMKNPYWPVDLSIMKAQLHFHSLAVAETIHVSDGITVRTMRGRHFDGTLLFRIESNGRSLCYISDYEHEGETDPALIEFVRGTDVLIYDAMYTNEEYYGTNGYTAKKGWGHSTWEEGCKLANVAGVKQLLLFHHEINRSDRDLEEIENLARIHFPNTFAARAGMEIKL